VSSIDFSAEYHKQESSFRITPSAAYYLKTYKILPSEVKPTGPKSYIQKGDVKGFISAKSIVIGKPRQSVKPEPTKVEEKMAAPTKKPASGSSDGVYDKNNLRK
jgi:hypothetical protein